MDDFFPAWFFSFAGIVAQGLLMMYIFPDADPWLLFWIMPVSVLMAVVVMMWFEMRKIRKRLEVTDANDNQSGA